MNPFKPMKDLMGDKLPCSYSLNDWNVSFFSSLARFLLCICSAISSLDHILKFSLVSVYDIKGEDNSEEKGEETDFFSMVWF